MLSALRKVLWVFRYPSFSSNLVGPYDVGVIQRRIPGSTDSQIFYPASTNKKNNDNDLSYFRNEAILGLADFSGQSSSLLETLLGEKRHPCLVNAQPLEFGNDNNNGFPVVLFSHGLGGCMEMYTQLCQQVASSGMIVVALEHEDGSGCYAKTESGETIFYKRPDNTPYSREKVVNFRKAFLQQRVKETMQAIEFFLAEKTEQGQVNDSSNDRLFSKVAQAIDQSKGVALFGHSFGGTTMALTTQQESISSKGLINSLTMLDPWAFTLDDDALQKGIPSSTSLSILSESWLDNPENKQILQLHSTTSPKDSLFYMPRSIHSSFSDTATWAPRFATRPLGLRGKKEKRHETIQSCANACINNIINSIESSEEKSVDLAPLVPFPIMAEEEQEELTRSKILAS